MVCSAGQPRAADALAQLQSWQKAAVRLCGDEANGSLFSEQEEGCPERFSMGINNSVQRCVRSGKW